MYKSDKDVFIKKSATCNLHIGDTQSMNSEHTATVLVLVLATFILVTRRECTVNTQQQYSYYSTLMKKAPQMMTSIPRLAARAVLRVHTGPPPMWTPAPAQQHAEPPKVKMQWPHKQRWPPLLLHFPQWRHLAVAPQGCWQPSST